MGKLYTILTDRQGNYALKLDNEFLYRTDDSVHGDKYAFEVGNYKSDKELTTEEDFANFVGRFSGKPAERPKYYDGDKPVF